MTTVHRSRTPRHAIARATALAGVAMAAAVLLASTPAPATGWQQGSAEATLFQLMNGARVNNGRRAVQQHGTLVSLARWRSKDQVDRNYFDHTILGTGYQVYHWYDTNGLNYSLGRREHRLEQRLQRRRFAGGHPPGLHGLARAPRQHPGVELHARRRGRLRQGQRHVPRQAAQPTLLHRALHRSRSRLRHRLHPREPAGGGSSQPPLRRRADGGGTRPARRASDTRPGPRQAAARRCAGRSARLSPMDGGTLVAAAPGSESTPNRAGAGLRR